MTYERAVNVQRPVTTDERAAIARYFPAGALVVAGDAQQAETTALSLYAVWGWRFVNDPRGWEGWPTWDLHRSRRAVFANEPDIEGYPSWYRTAQDQWRAAGGLVLEPPWSDEGKRADDGYRYDAVACHCYAGEFRNLSRARGRAGGLPVVVTEYGRPHGQERCLGDLAGVPEACAIFAWRWLGNASAGYDVADLALSAQLIEGSKPVGPSTALLGWIAGTLAGLGLQTTTKRAAMLLAWAWAEEGREELNPTNPLNTTWRLPGSRDFNSVGVQSYAGAADGIRATVWTLQLPAYATIRADLAAERTGSLAADVYASPWGTMSGIDVAAALAALGEGSGWMDEAIARQQWESNKADVAVNPDAAIYKDWLARRLAGDHSLGVPTSQEFTLDGATYQYFTGAVARWDAATGVSWA